MAYADIKAAIVVHAAAAAAALTTPITDARAGFPIPKQRCVRVYYAGETAPERMGGGGLDQTGEMVSHITRIALFLPVSVTDEALAAVLDAELFNFGHDLRTRILGDSTLDGTTTDLVLHYLEPDLATYNNVRYLIGMWDVVTDYIEYTRAQ